MKRLQVMDSRLGDRLLTWDENDLASQVTARAEFDRVINEGGRVFKTQPNGEGGGTVGEFDPSVDMIATPKIIGG